MSSTDSTMRAARDSLLRPLQIVSGIVNRRMVPDIMKFVPCEGQSARRKEPARRPKSALAQAAASSGIAGDQIAADVGSSDGDGSGGDDGDGDGDGDGPRRRSHASASPSSPSPRAARRKPVPLECSDRSHTHALVTLAFLAISVFVMAFLMVERGHLWLAAEVMTALGGLPRLARALVRPK